MSTEERIRIFAALGDAIRAMPPSKFESLSLAAINENPWFTADNVRLALDGISSWLHPELLARWLEPYPLDSVSPQTVAVIMAGNIPLAGFHDLMCVLISGHTAQAKPSSKDSVMFRYLADLLQAIGPELASQFKIQEGPLKGFDAAIATGSDNSARYFNQYFGKYPSIIRKNRTAVSVLTGNESEAELQELGRDVFSYFGLGCRNVSKLLVPKDYSFDKMFNAWLPWQKVIHHHKYVNNYDYQKSILLVNGTTHFDNGFVLVREEPDAIVSPLATLYYATYNDVLETAHTIEQRKEKIQCVIGTYGSVSFGKAQLPAVNDYADKVDTMRFLTGLRK